MAKNNDPIRVEVSVTPEEIEQEIESHIDGPVWQYIQMSLDIFAKYGLLSPEGYRVHKYIFSGSGEDEQ